MPLMGNLYIGASGLQTSQNALNSTAHNITNVDTKGYTRQQVLQATRQYNTIATDPRAVANQQTGLGVNYSRVRQVRDYFLDKTYRKESGRSMFYEVSTDCMMEVENLLGELNGEAFQTTLSDLWTSIQELAKDPGSSVTQGLLVQRATQFIERATNVYEDLSAYQDNLNLQTRQMVNKINSYGNQILELNDKIRMIESAGVEKANDLRDARNQILDELGSMVKITYNEDFENNVWVQIEGVDFVKNGNCYEIGMKTDETTGFETPFWPQNAKYTVMDDGTRNYRLEGAEVFNFNLPVSSDLDTDIGSLKATILARGDHRADYRDIENNYDDISQSILMNVQAEFDQLIHNVVTKINEVLAGASDSDTGYLCNADGTSLQLFVTITPETETAFTLKNVQVNGLLQQEPSRLSFRRPDGTVDYDTAKKLKAAFTEQEYYLNPNVLKKTNFVDYYTDLVSQVANSGSVFRSIADNQAATAEATLYAREQIVGVSSDEELSNMIKFQNAYNASSRYINVIDEMLEHIIQTLAM